MKLVDSQSLEVYLDTADRLQATIRHRHAQWFATFKEIDVIWREELFGGKASLAPVPASLSVQSFYAWLSAVRVALSGHATAVYPLLRYGLEAACYAYKMADDPALTQIWLSRDKDPASRKRCRQAFGSAVSDVSKLPDIDTNLRAVIREMYDASIDFGGHPNPRALLDHISFPDDNDQTEVALTFVGLNDASSANTLRSLAAVAEHGYFTIVICANARENGGEVSGLQARLNALIARIQTLVQPHI